MYILQLSDKRGMYKLLQSDKRLPMSLFLKHCKKLISLKIFCKKKETTIKGKQVRTTVYPI